jgi:molybdenum cofactor cytidylyltransferase
MNKAPPRLSIIIPAAGASKRLGQPKQLVQYQGKALIQRAIDNVASLEPHEVLVVTGANADAVQAVVQKSAVKCVYNVDWDDGLGASIARGAQAVDGQSKGILITLCDQWRVSAEDLRQLLSAWQADPERIVCSETGNRCGPPVIFPSSCLQELRNLQGDSGAHSIIEAHPDLLRTIALRSAASDLDTPSQLNELNRA